MQTILVKPRNAEEFQLVSQLMKRMKIKADVVPDETPNQKKEREFLDSFDHRAEDIKAHLRGEKKLQSARDFLNEL